MTPEELEQLVLDTKDTEAIRLAFQAMDEKARKKLSTTASTLHRQLFDGKANAAASDRLKQFLSKRSDETYTHWNSQANSNAALAVFAVGPLSAVKKWQTRPSYEHRNVFRKIIADRRPDWISDWVAHELEQDWTHLEFPIIRSWVRAGIISKPVCEGYYRQFAAHLMRTGFHTRGEEYVPPLSTQLLEAPDLLDDIEGLFKFETNAFNTNSWLVKGAPEHYETWPQALVKLADGGHYDRGKMLDLSLAGLQADIKQNQLSGYHKFFKQLAPTQDELTQRQPALIALLCHSVGHVAKFAIEMLTKLESAKRLDDDQVLRELPSVFAGESKGNGIAALRLLDKVLKRSAKKHKGVPAPAALSAVIEGLRHANADVQAKAITLLETYAEALDKAQWQDIDGFGGFVAASNRAALASMLDQADGAVDTSARAMPVAKPGDMEAYEPDRRLFAEWSVLGDETRITPVASLEELIDLALHCVEVVGNADEVERLIDGISRFADERPSDFYDRVKPMVHRLNKGSTGAGGIGVAYPGIAENMLALLLTWATGELHGAQKRDLTYYTREDAFVPMIAHIHALAQRVHRCEARQLLSSATHQGGWIDPLVWTQRLIHLQSTGGVEDSMDFRLSLLRLAPDNRAEALDEAEGLTGDTGRIARFVLGSDDVPQRADRKHYAAWVTAARARDPQADWSDFLAVLATDDPWAGGAVPVVFSWDSSHKTGSYGTESWKVPILDVSVARADGRQVPLEDQKSSLLQLGKVLAGRKKAAWQDLPTAAVHRQPDSKYYWSSELNTAWVSQWLFYIWPQNSAYAYFRCTRKLMERMDDNASNWTPAHGFFQALFVPGRVWDEAGHLLLTLGLASKDADAKGLAIDALIEGIETRAFDSSLFAKVLTRLTAGEWVKYNRLGDSLKQVVQVSPLHSVAIGTALQQWLQRFDLSQRNAFYVLEALVEAQAIAAQPLTDEVRLALEQVSGKTKTAKLAKRALSLEP